MPTLGKAISGRDSAAPILEYSIAVRYLDVNETPQPLGFYADAGEDGWMSVVEEAGGVIRTFLEYPRGCCHVALVLR